MTTETAGGSDTTVAPIGSAPDQTAPDLSARVIHMVSDDALTLTSVYDGPEGVVTVTVGWKDSATAEVNHLNAATRFENQLPHTLSGITDRRQAHNWLRTLGPVRVAVLTGPPTWWLPRPLLRLRPQPQVGFGWLRVAVVLSRR